MSGSLKFDVKGYIMGTMAYGFHYDRGQRVGYDISFGSIILWFVSSKDKARIIREAKECGYGHGEITVERVGA